MEGVTKSKESASRADKVDRGGRNMSMSFTDLRTPIVDNFLSLVPMGHEKALKYAFYNVLALVLSSGIVLAFWGVYCILEPFIKSLLWALLVGSVLHPFKGNLRSLLLAWLKEVKKSPTPFAVKVSTSPLIIADSLSDQIGNYVISYWKSIVSVVGVFFGTYALYYNPPMRLAWFGQFVITALYRVAAWCLGWVNGPVVLTLNVAYIGYVIHFLTQKVRPEDSVDPKPGEKGNHRQSLNEALNSDETDTTSSEQSAKQEISGTTTANKSTNIDPKARRSNFENASPNMMKELSYLSWGLTFAYMCLHLPYYCLVALAIFVILGAVSYLRGRDKSSARLTIPSISRHAFMMVMNIGRDTNIGPVTASTSRIVSPRPSLGHDHSTENSPDSNRPAAESSLVMERQAQGNLHRSYSEGSRDSFLKQSNIGSDENEETMRDPIVYPSHLDMPSPIYSDGGVDQVEGPSLDSNKFLYWVFCACCIVQVWNHLWLLRLIPIPIIYFFLKKLCWRVGIGEYWRRSIQRPFEKFYSDVKGPSGTIFPTPLRVAFRILGAGDRKLISICETYVDPVTSIVVLVFVVMATIIGLIFSATQVYAEGDHLVRVGVNLINSTVSQHPEINEILPEGWQSVMDSMAQNAYQYGREYITNMIRDSIAEKNPEKAEILEKQVIDIWDRIYLSWNQTWDNAWADPATTPEKPKLDTHDSGTKPVEWDAILETGKEVPQLLEVSVLVNYARANVGTLWSVFDSVWNILIGNISLALSALTSFLSVVFGGGTALLNFMINFVVFFTALFYLLSSSTSAYKPVELFNVWLPGNGAGNSFASAVEEAISGVFVASFKMASFYGMWTWLIHSLFQVNIVFIPSILAALLGAVPFLMPYWAAFPAVLELWLIQGHWPKALLMFLAQMAPMSVVDTQIYSEIKGGGHPYLTGLAVAGGIFCFGSQGAIMGPVVLCCVFVVIKVSGKFMQEEPEMQHREAHASLSNPKRQGRQRSAFEDDLDKSFTFNSVG